MQPLRGGPDNLPSKGRMRPTRQAPPQRLGPQVRPGRWFANRASVVGKGTTKHTRDFIEAWNATSTCVNQCVTLDPGYRALRDYWHDLSPTSRIYINWRPTLIFVQPPLHPLMFELQTLDSAPPIFHVFIILISAHPLMFEL